MRTERARRNLAQLVVLSYGMAVGASACNRYEYREPTCPAGPPLPKVEMEVVPGRPNSIEGIVSAENGSGNIASVSVLVLPRVAGAFGTNEGTFRIDSVPQGRYALTVRPVGFEARRVDSVQVSAAAGVRLHIQLRLQPMDGCPGFAMLRVRKPWWKVW